MILSETCLTSKITSTHFYANKIPTPLMPSSFPTQNNLNLESFPSTNLADAPLHLTFCKPQMSTWHLDITTSFDWPLIVPTIHEHTLKFWCDNWLMIWRCSYLTRNLLLGTPSTWWFPAPHSHWTALKTVLLYIVAKFYSRMSFIMPTCNSQGKLCIFPWCSGYHYCTTSFNKAWTKVLCRFQFSTWRFRDLQWWGSLIMVLAGNKAKCLFSVNHITKTIHHHHHHHHHHHGPQTPSHQILDFLKCSTNTYITCCAFTIARSSEHH